MYINFVWLFDIGFQRVEGYYNLLFFIYILCYWTQQTSVDFLQLLLNAHKEPETPDDDDDENEEQTGNKTPQEGATNTPRQGI